MVLLQVLCKNVRDSEGVCEYRDMHQCTRDGQHFRQNCATSTRVKWIRPLRSGVDRYRCPLVLTPVLSANCAPPSLDLDRDSGELVAASASANLTL
jgi:hypothetical protein